MPRLLCPLLFVLAAHAALLNACGKSSHGFGGTEADSAAPTFAAGGGGCSAGGAICVGNEVHACSADGGPGALIKTCDAGGGEVCFGGVCKAGCEAAADQPSNMGCEFWAVHLKNEYSSVNDAENQPWGVVLSNPGLAPANITVEHNVAAPGAPQALETVKTLTIAPGKVAEIPLPNRHVDGSLTGQDDGTGTCITSTAVRITSTMPIVGYQFNPLKQSFSNDASLLLPRNGLGMVHRVLGWPTANPVAVFPMPGLPDHSYVTVVGVAPNTHVSVTLGGPIIGGGGIAAAPKGGTVQATLGPFDVLNLDSDGAPGDLSGTIVQADQPVAVFSGGERATAPETAQPPPPPNFDPSKQCCTDHIEEQVFPVESMGRHYAIARSPIRSVSYVEPDILRFMGVAAAARVTTSLPPPDDLFTLQPGEVRETWTTTDFVVDSTEPIAVAQLLVSGTFTNPAGRYIGDPSLTIFAPVEQFRADYLFLIPTSWDADYIVIASPAGTDVALDGAPLPPGCVLAKTGTLGNVTYDARRCPIAEGPHRLTGSAPFGLTMYGYGPAGSYAVVGGADVKKIYVPPPLK